MVNRNAGKMLLVIMTVLLCQWLFAGMLAAEEPAKMVQGGVTLTVAESKRLIAKAVAQMPIVKNALANGLVIITKGTTNAYVAEEITGHKITFTEFTGGRITGQGPQALPKGKSAPHMVLEKGKAVDISLPDAVKKLKAGDVVLKGANALDYKNKLAAVDIMGSNGGTTGIAMPYIVGRKAYLVIPVGLEKLVAGDIVDLTVKMREPMESLGTVPSMWLLTGEIVTELEAIKMLTGATAFQSSAGGVNGAEGGVWLVIRGTKGQVSNALKLIRSIKGEPPYTE